MTGPVVRGGAPFDPLRLPRDPPRPGNARAILGFYLSLLATVLGPSWFAMLAVVFALTGFVLSLSGWEAARSDPGRGYSVFAILGMILSVVALVLAWRMLQQAFGPWTST